MNRAERVAALQARRAARGMADPLNRLRAIAANLALIAGIEAMNRPDHLFLSDIDGSLFDTRDPSWNVRPPLRTAFVRHVNRIETPAELKATLRAGSMTNVGGYPLFLRMADGEPASFEGVRANLRECLAAFRSPYRHDSWRVVGCEVHWEGAPMECAITGKDIPSAYGETLQEVGE